MTKEHEKLVLRILKENGPLGRAELVEKTGMSVRRIGYLVQRLKRKGLIRDKPVLHDMRRLCYVLAES
jgi:DNA-binding MarR family transcriptional regulator